MEIRTPLIAIMVSIILLVIYLRKNIPQLISARIFFVFLVSVFACNICEILECTAFMLIDEKSSAAALREVTQILYVGSLLFSAFIMCIYIYAKTTLKRAVSNLVVVITGIPALIAVIIAIVMGIDVGVNEWGYYYNCGTAVTICYAIGFTYVLLSILRVIYFKNRIRKDSFFSILSGLIVWAILLIYQFIDRAMQVSAVAMMIMALILFLSMENPREYYERSIDGVRNRDAFEMALLERMGMRREFFVVSVIFTGKTAVMSNSERSEMTDLMKIVGKISESHVGTPAYLFNWNTLCSIVRNPERVETFMNIVNNLKDNEGKNYRLTFSVLELPKYASEADKALQILTYVSGEYAFKQSSPNLVIDQAVVDKMTYRNSIEDVVRTAVKEKSFDVYYQPILSVEDGSFSSAEALVRLQRPDKGKFISPEDFIPIAEKCGLIQEIDDLVFEKVCSFIARENLQAYGIKTIEVNLSGNEVVDEQTHIRLINKMNKYQIPPDFINFEITETSYINNDEVFKENVARLRESGSTISMDDFGSGYSNLLEILKMDYALVKMDKEFVWSCLDKDKPENMRMLDYTIKFLKDFGLHILAEGVETMDQAKILIDKGVEYLQGFYYSRPIPEEEYIDFLKAQKGLFAKGE
ncbi:EAL domain-containing protein [Butyrivibrio proteoclasticus]|uniref:EAL domain-containing protein n=1 Tax=Butyrivibrio proteoclasticus TaxID=43305 RepID=UPI0009E05624|nr:EAL domain-containing protein [Butyrivibrio proteoclasticus]